MKKEIRRILKMFPMLYLAEGGKHYQLRRRDNGALIAAVSRSSSDVRSYRNTISDIRRALSNNGGTRNGNS